MSSLFSSHLSSPDAARSKPAPASRTDLLFVVAAGVLWGTGGLAGALLGRLGELHPVAVATYRLAGGGLSVLAVLALTGRLTGIRAAGTRAVSTRILAVGLLTASYQACYFAAVSVTFVGVATLVTLGAAPVLVLAAEAVRERRRPSVASTVAIALAVAGLALLLGVPRAAGGGQLLLGALLALVAAGGFAGLTLLGRRPVAGLDGLGTIGFGFVAGALMLAVVTAPTVGLGFAPTAATVGLLLFFSWVPTALAYALYFTGLRGISASSASVVAVLEPVTATVLGALVLSERLGVVGMAGAGLLCAAALVAGRRG